MSGDQIIDVHHHLSAKPDDWKKLADECGRLKIRKIICFGNNEAVAKAMEAFPDLIVGFGLLRLGMDNALMVDEFVKMGFRGIKFIRPAANYDNRNYYRIYGRMEEKKLIAIYHLGIVSNRNPQASKFQDVDNNRHRPIYLDTISRAFPDLAIIGAHLGNPWYEEASMSARWDPKLYFDLSGSTLKKKTPEFIGNLLWWKEEGLYSPHKQNAWEKIVFGSDVEINMIEDTLNDYLRLFEALELPEEYREKVLYGTMAGLLGLGAAAKA